MTTTGWCDFATARSSPNFETGNDGRDAVVLHVTDGTFASALDWLRKRTSKVSSHFLIGPLGEIIQLVSIWNTAYTNGLRPLPGGRWETGGGEPVQPTWPRIRPGINPNRTTITVEMAGRPGNAWTAAQEAALIRVLRWIAAQTGLEYIPFQTLIGHCHINPVDKPNCPGPRVDFNRVAALVQPVRPLPPAGTVTPASPLLAAPGVTAPQCIQFICREAHGGYSIADITRVIVPTYFRICTKVGIDPLIAIAQMLHETDNLRSWWSQRPRRNPAGIGVTGAIVAKKPASGKWQQGPTGQWLEGCRFDAWDKDAIPAHVGRLLAYALRDDQVTPAQRALIATALHVRPLPVGYRGAAQSLAGLTGRWATDPDYATKIARRANELQTFGARRAAA